MESSGQWVYFEEGRRVSAPSKEECPPDVQCYWYVDGCTYDSPEAYAQIQETIRVQGEANKARYDQNPQSYPPCSADPPCGPEVQCGNEFCNMHNILWLESEGFSHQQAIEITSVYYFSEHWGYGPVADALGGMDEFTSLTSEDPAPAALNGWLEKHQALVYYIMETNQKGSDGLWAYWWNAISPESYPIYDTGRVSIHLIKQPDGTYQPYQAPGQPLLIPQPYEQWQANYEATKASLSEDQWANHTIGHFEYTNN